MSNYSADAHSVSQDMLHIEDYKEVNLPYKSLELHAHIQCEIVYFANAEDTADIERENALMKAKCNDFLMKRALFIMRNVKDGVHLTAEETEFKALFDNINNELNAQGPGTNLDTEMQKFFNTWKPEIERLGAAYQSMTDDRNKKTKRGWVEGWPGHYDEETKLWDSAKSIDFDLRRLWELRAMLSEIHKLGILSCQMLNESTVCSSVRSGYSSDSGVNCSSFRGSQVKESVRSHDTISRLITYLKYVFQDQDLRRAISSI